VSRLFDRRWRVTIDTIELDALDIAFRVEKHLKPEPNTCDLTIYNLNKDHQAQLENLRPKGKKATTGIPCRIEAGYVDPGPQLIWLGDLRTVETTKDGPDWVTHLTSGDGEKGWQNARIHVAFGPKTDITTALRAMARALGVDEGNIGKVAHRLKMAGSAIFPAGKVYAGAAQRAVMDFARSADLDISIQDNALQVLDRGKALAGEAILISTDTGLIGSPTVDNEGIITLQAAMIPDVQCGRVVQVEAVRIKGAYKIAEAVWTGDSRGDDWGIEIRGPRY
jgi:hypothetical protein